MELRFGEVLNGIANSVAAKSRATEFIPQIFPRLVPPPSISKANDNIIRIAVESFVKPNNSQFIKGSS